MARALLRWESGFNHSQPMPRWQVLCRIVEWLGYDCLAPAQEGDRP